MSTLPRPPSCDLVTFYEIKETIAFLAGNKEKYRKVCLQFPDELLADAYSVVDILHQHNTFSSPDCNFEFFVLGDTSYNSCCVDTVAAAHVDCDVIVHYGPSCLSPCEALPVFFVFGVHPLPADTFVDVIIHDFPAEDVLLVIFDTQYVSAAPAIMAALAARPGYNNIMYSLPTLTEHNSVQKQLESAHMSSRFKKLPVAKDGRTLYVESASPMNKESKEEDDSTTTIFVGHEGMELTATALARRPDSVYLYDAGTHKLSLTTVDNSPLLNRRFYLVEKAKKTKVFGILVGTLGISHHDAITRQIRQALDSAKRQHYTIVVGKINGPKLGNFPEIEMFVMVACRIASLLDSRDLPSAVITPHELFLALSNSPWTARLQYDFNKVHLSGFANINSDSSDDNDDDRNSNRNHKNFNEQDCKEIVSAHAEKGLMLAESAGAAFLASRSYQGLDNSRLAPDDRNTQVHEGLFGRARSYIPHGDGEAKRNEQAPVGEEREDSGSDSDSMYEDADANADDDDDDDDDDYFVEERK